MVCVGWGFFVSGRLVRCYMVFGLGSGLSEKGVVLFWKLFFFFL